MREIKFRAWDGGLMHSVAELVFDMGPNLDGKGIRFYGPGVGEGRVDGENIILMQFTGSRDKNSAEIYEGDIVTVRTKYGMSKGVVLFKDSEFMVCWDSNIDFPRNGAIKNHYYLNGNNKVLGNIYENPELLEVPTC